MVAISGESPMGLKSGLLTSAGRGFSPPPCIVLLSCMCCLKRLKRGVLAGPWSVRRWHTLSGQPAQHGHH